MYAMEIRRLSRTLTASLAVLALTAGLVIVTSSPAAACLFPPPELTATPTQGSAGDTITVTGTNWFEASGDIAPNCVGAIITVPPTVDVTWAQAGTTVVLATSVPVDNYAFSAEVEIPGEATAGAATIAATSPMRDHPCTCAAEFTVLEPTPRPEPPSTPAPPLPRSPRFTG
jgi:hypothetical protein